MIKPNYPCLLLIFSFDIFQDLEEEGIPSSIASSNQQNAVSNRSAHLRNRNRVLKKRNQLQKDLENALPLAAPEKCSMSEERSFGTHRVA